MEHSEKDEFIVGKIGPRGLIAVFEQDDATGFLYLTEENYKVREALHVFNRSKLSVKEDDVRVVWNKSGDRCGVMIGGKLRAVIEVNGDRYRPVMESLCSKPITEREWLTGFPPES